MRSRKKIFIIAAIVIVAALVVVFIPKGKGNAVEEVKSIKLKPSTLQSTLSANGVVESVDSKNVYGKLAYPIKTVNVKVGDTVKAGDILCLVDSEDLEQQIAQKQASMNSANVATYFQLSESEKKYNEAKNNMENNTNVELNNAESVLKTAELDLATAKAKFDGSQKSQTDSNDSSLIKARTDLSNAEINYKASMDEYNKMIEKDNITDKTAIKKAEEVFLSARTALLAAKDNLVLVQGKDEKTVSDAANKVNDAKKVYDDALSAVFNTTKTDQLYNQRKAVKSYEDIYDTAKTAYDKILRGIGGDMIQYSQALDNAQINYDKAKKAYDTTKLSMDQQLDSYKSTMEKDQNVISNDAQLVELNNLQKKLSQCTVTSPIAGTVTAVYVKEGSVPNGVMFMVEDTSGLKIKAKIKEYDVGSIGENMKVVIKSDATGDTEYEGYISKIAPTAVKADLTAGTGTGTANTDTQFEFEVTVKSADTKLRIGMNTRLSIISEEKENILSVKYDAIGKNKDDQDVVYVAKDKGNGIYTVEEVPVTTGLETDFEVEVIGEGLTEGTIIITDIDKVKQGQNVSLSK